MFGPNYRRLDAAALEELHERFTHQANVWRAKRGQYRYVGDTRRARRCQRRMRRCLRHVRAIERTARRLGVRL